MPLGNLVRLFQALFEQLIGKNPCKFVLFWFFYMELSVMAVNVIFTANVDSSIQVNHIPHPIFLVFTVVWKIFKDNLK